MTKSRPCLYFGEFRIDPLNASLSRTEQVLALSPKAFDVLVYFCTNPGRLISKDELLDAVWPRRFVSEGVLKNTIQELRKTLGDDPKFPSFIETVHRRGYRFIAEVRDDQVFENHTTLFAPVSKLVVGREALLTCIEQAMQRVLGGHTETIFLSGEPGIGKTTLIQTFTERASVNAICVQGQCVEQYGQGEPYLPLLEAINQLARQSGEDSVHMLRRYAPTWLAQLPWLIAETDRTSLQCEAQGATKDRMLRELGEFFERWSEVHPTVLVIEDLHWSDHATLDAVNYLARSKNNVRLMLLGSYRQAEVSQREHPFKTLRDELLLHGDNLDLQLGLLSKDDVSQYLKARFCDREFPSTLAETLFQRTEGLPLFLVSIADEMERSNCDYSQVLVTIPDGLMRLIELQLDRLGDNEKPWLEVAAVCGDSFVVETLADVTETAAIDIEHWCELQVRTHRMLRHANQDTAYDAGCIGSYSFIHAYYQEQAYKRIPPMKKALLHSRIGKQLEAAYGSRAKEIAAELAVHFERGGVYERATHYLFLAAQNALSRHATHEAATLLQRSLELLDAHMPEEAEFQQRRLAILNLLPPALIAIRGYGMPELDGMYRRAQELATGLGDMRMQFFALYGMWMFHLARGELDLALDIAEQLSAQAKNSRDHVQSLSAYLALGTTLMFLGRHQLADGHFEQGKAHAAELGAACDQLAHIFGQDPLASLLAMQAITAQTLGDLDRALTLIDIACQRADALAHPYTKAYLLFCRIWFYRDRGEPQKVQEYLGEFEQQSAIHGFPVMVNTVRIFSGWAAVVLSRDATGIDLIELAITLLGAFGTRLTKTVYYQQLADACFRLGQYEDSLRATDLALAEVEFSGERRYEAETWRLRGELLKRLENQHSDTPEQCFEKALAIAHKQQARLLELRIATSLARMHEPPAANAIQRLRDIYTQFTEGLETPYLLDAQSLLGM